MRTIALTLLAVTGCSSSYMPQTRGRVAVMIRSGTPAYVRDGQVYEHGLLGSGLVDVVEGNPAAMEAANEYHDRMLYGLLGVAGGTAAMIGGSVYTLAHLSGPSEEEFDRAATIGLGAILVGTVVALAGSLYLASAEPYRWDAINMFNDAPAMPPLPGGPGWSASTAPHETLKMRD